MFIFEIVKLIAVNTKDITIDVLVKTVKISFSAFELRVSVGSHCNIVNAQNVNTQNVIQKEYVNVFNKFISLDL